VKCALCRARRQSELYVPLCEVSGSRDLPRGGGGGACFRRPKQRPPRKRLRGGLASEHVCCAPHVPTGDRVRTAAGLETAGWASARTTDPTRRETSGAIPGVGSLPTLRNTREMRSSRDTSAADLKFLNPRGEFFQERQIEKRH